ncbi:MAG: ribonuclease HII [Flavobacteriia bacterium]|nr:ribonuclease HII [Flavobacteriia bacterium]OJX36938.1 MAG: ribonuclease HII [Flavobacteriia bacterium 40-80]
MSNLANSYTQDLTEAGCDEAGRGCLIGPVYAAAVILPPDFDHPFLNDSKKITDKKREELRLIIEEKALGWAVSAVDHEKIDEINILNASFLAMRQAVEQLKTQPELLLIDGNRFKPFGIPHQCIVGGDAKYKSIAAASILAKTHRDEYVRKLALEFPQYEWEKNKGYSTPRHKQLIIEHGESPYQRKTFNYRKNQIVLNFE